MKTLYQLFKENPDGKFAQEFWEPSEYIQFSDVTGTFFDESHESYRICESADEKKWQLYGEPKIDRTNEPSIVELQAKDIRELARLKKENEKLKRSHLFMIERNQELLDKNHELIEKNGELKADLKDSQALVDTMDERVQELLKNQNPSNINEYFFRIESKELISAIDLQGALNKYCDTFDFDVQELEVKE